MSEKPIRPTATLYDAVQAIEESHRRIAIVTTEDNKLVGTLTDGDIRRSLLSGGSLETLVSEAMNHSPVTALVNTSNSYIIKLLKDNNLRTLPLVDNKGFFIRVVHITELTEDDNSTVNQVSECFTAAVIMAGGEGMRLRPITNNIPKPMVDIGGLPLLERQVHRLVKAGVNHILISVNYLSHVIEEHFGNGSKFGAKINYLKETNKLGTAGALSLIEDKPNGPMLVINGDVLTTSDFVHLYQYHTDHDAAITVSAIDYRIQIPYGVIHAEGAFVESIEEKPSQRFFCNAGIYAISPEVLEMLQTNHFYNMPELIEDCLAANRNVVVFPVHEYWTDIGTPDDLEEARRVFDSVGGL